ncbi:hypothetical protein D3C80_1778340 [compost metagenome]
MNRSADESKKTGHKWHNGTRDSKCNVISNVQSLPIVSMAETDSTHKVHGPNSTQTHGDGGTNDEYQSLDP